MIPFWISVHGPELAQGDFLPRCLIPVFAPGFKNGAGASDDVTLRNSDLVVVTQSCDLANAKSGFGALCPIYHIGDIESVNPPFRKKGVWEQVRKGRFEGLHLLASPTNPANNRDALVVEFRQIFTLPIDYLTQHAESLGPRWRLQSPFLEHFSQAFARFFMRVGLPSAIPAYD